jgi:hypothetical protein
LEEPISNFELFFNVRRYEKVEQFVVVSPDGDESWVAGVYTRPLLGST